MPTKPPEWVWRLLLLIAGIAIAAASWTRDDAAGVITLAIGAALVAGAGVLPRLTHLRAGPSGVEMHARSEAELTADLAAAGESPLEPTAQMRSRRDLAVDRYVLGHLALHHLLASTDPFQFPVELRLFLFDAEARRLRALIEPDGPGSEGWAVGSGVVGTAWRDNRMVICTEEECSDASYGLDAEQQQRYAELRCVVGVPVANAMGSPIAVLAASTAGEPATLTAETSIEALTGRARQVARVLIDLLDFGSDSIPPDWGEER